MTEAEKKERNCTVDFIKGIAVLFVVITHYAWTSDQRRVVVFPYLINMAVPCFMIVTGYVNSLSLSRQRVKHLEEAYTCGKIIKRIVRYTLPLCAVIILELTDHHFKVDTSSVLGLIKWAICGTAGKGNYYYPVIVQIVFIFPVIYFIMRKNSRKGLILCFALNAAYELLTWAYGMNAECYRLLAFRYIFLIAAGVFASEEGNRLSIFSAVLMTAAGGVYIYFYRYGGYVPQIENRSWASTNFASSMFIMPLTIWIIQNCRIRIPPVNLAGKASYHIFLFQMVYYRGYFSSVKRMISGVPGQLAVSIAICFLAGIIFFYIDKLIQNKLDKHMFKFQGN